MSSWFFYAPVTAAAAKRAVDSAYKALGKVVGAEVAEEIEVGDELDPAMLGVWPGLSASSSVPTTNADDEEGYEEGEGVEAAAIALLATCKAAVRIDRPAGFDPALVTATRAICASLGSCVFTDDPGTALVTSETLLKKIAGLADLVTAMKDGDDLGGEDADEDEDEDEDDEEDDDAEAEAPEPTAAETAEARPEVIRATLAEIAQNPRARRKAGELLSGASDAVGAFAERLARNGVETDAAVAKALNMKEPEVKAARFDLARLLRRLEG